MHWLPFLFGIATAASWLFAAINWILALRNRVPGGSTLLELMSGMKAFNPDLFTEVGRRYQRRFMMGFAGFFVCMVLTVASAALTQSLS